MLVTVLRAHRIVGHLATVGGSRACSGGHSGGLPPRLRSGGARCESGGLTNARQFLLPFTVICVVSLVLLLPWLASRERRVHEALALNSQALKEVKAGREWLASCPERKPAKQVL